MPGGVHPGGGQGDGARHEGDLVGHKLPAGGEGELVYAPDDPSVFTPDLAPEHHARQKDIAFSLLARLIGVAAVVVGAVAL